MCNLNDSANKLFIKSLLHEILCKMNTNEIMNLVGSMGVEKLNDLYSRLNYEKYCEKHNIAYEDMTDDDRIDAYFEYLEERAIEGQEVEMDCPVLQDLICP